jgi:transcriptional regulator with XRE-family HTH domain
LPLVSAIFDSQYQHKECDLGEIFLTREQCRAARALIGWSRKNLASASQISLQTIADFERGARLPRSGTRSALRVALETAGVAFICKGNIGVGVEDSTGRQILDRRVQATLVESTEDVDFTPAQCRAARALLDLTQPQLAEASSLGLSTIVDFERERRAVSAQATTAMRAALEAAGVVFIAENGGGIGVRLRARPVDGTDA